MQHIYHKCQRSSARENHIQITEPSFTSLHLCFFTLAHLNKLLDRRLILLFMASLLPTELWTAIVRLAITRIWTSEFIPPADDVECVSGFAMAMPVFNAIVESLRYEVLVISPSEIMSGNEAEDAEHWQRVRRVDRYQFSK